MRVKGLELSEPVWLQEPLGPMSCACASAAHVNLLFKITVASPAADRCTFKSFNTCCTTFDGAGVGAGVGLGIGNGIGGIGLGNGLGAGAGVGEGLGVE